MESNVTPRSLQRWHISGRRERLLVIALAVGLVLLRSAVFVFGAQPQFDSDEAIVGLMAKHLSEMRALPIFFYGQHYMLAVEAWLAAPLFYFGGPSLTALKLPLLGINVAVAILLLLVLERELQLRPIAALVPTLFFIMPPPGTALLLLQANGGNIEPFLYVLLLWLVRRQPLIFGAVLAVGFLNREFTAYGLGALLLIEASSGSLTTKRGLQGKMLASASLVAVFHVVSLLKTFGSAAGPGTTVASIERLNNFEELAIRGSCWPLSGIPAWLTKMFGSHLGALFTGEMGWLWLVVGTTMIAAVARIVLLAVRTDQRPWLTAQFPTYLTVVGLLAAVVHAVSRCGNIDILRYTLLALFGLVGVTALYMKLEANRRLKATLTAIVLLWAAINAAAHTRYAFDHYTSPLNPSSPW